MVVGNASEKTRIIVVEPIEALVDGTAPEKIAKHLSHIDNHYGTFPPCEWLKKIAYLYGMEGFDGFFRGLTRQQENAAMLKLGSTQTTPSGLVFMPKIEISGLILLGAPGCGAPQRARASEGGAAQKRRRSALGEATQDDITRQETYELVKQEILRNWGRRRRTPTSHAGSL